jgi:hypothetical protein
VSINPTEKVVKTYSKRIAQERIFFCAVGTMDPLSGVGSRAIILFI